MRTLSQFPKAPSLQGHGRDKSAVAGPHISMRRPDPHLAPKPELTLLELFFLMGEKRGAKAFEK
jgi:hypothetical protein